MATTRWNANNDKFQWQV